jgi:hypothetical protein
LWRMSCAIGVWMTASRINPSSFRVGTLWKLIIQLWHYMTCTCNFIQHVLASSGRS